MKKIYLLTVFICNLSYSQMYPTEHYNFALSYQSGVEKHRAFLSENKVKSIQMYSVSDKKGRVLTKASNYDEKGYLLNTKKLHKKDKYILTEYNYHENGLTNEVKRYSDDKLTFSSKRTYNNLKRTTLTLKMYHKKNYSQKREYKYLNDSLIVGELFYHRKDTSLIRSKNEFKYREDGKLLENNHFSLVSKRKRSLAIFSRTAYSYYENGDKKETNHYNKKGELKYTWSYDCSPKGVLEQTIHKDTTTICIKEEVNQDGDLVKTIRRTNEKNEIEIIREVHKDGVIRQFSSEGINGQMKSWWYRSDTIYHNKKYLKGVLWIEDKTLYNKNGKVIERHRINHKKSKYSWFEKSKIDENGKVIELKHVNQGKAKYSWSEKYTFDEKGMLIEKRRFNYKNELMSVLEYEREFYDN